MEDAARAALQALICHNRPTNRFSNQTLLVFQAAKLTLALFIQEIQSVQHALMQVHKNL
jgi:hypothetical protein